MEEIWRETKFMNSKSDKESGNSTRSRFDEIEELLKVIELDKGGENRIYVRM